MFLIEDDISISVILGRGFLATEGVNIDLLERKLTLRVSKEKEEFNVVDRMRNLIPILLLLTSCMVKNMS